MHSVFSHLSSFYFILFNILYPNIFIQKKNQILKQRGEKYNENENVNMNENDGVRKSQTGTKEAETANEKNSFI